jgi:hypothetical protein
MITFAIHYLPNIQSIGLFPLFTEALQNKYIGEKYCKSIPKVFPPLPIRRTISLKIDFNFKELLNLFKENHYKEINYFLSASFYKTEIENLEKISKSKEKIFDKIKKYIINKIKSKIEEQDKYIINLFSDEKMRVPNINKFFIERIFSLPKLELIKDYYFLYNALNEQKNELYKPKNNKEYIFNINSFVELKKELEEILNLSGIYFYELFEKLLNDLKKEEFEISKIIEENKKKA